MVQTGDPSQSAPDQSATLQRSQMMLSQSLRPDATATPRYDSVKYKNVQVLYRVKYPGKNKDGMTCQYSGMI